MSCYRKKENKKDNLLTETEITNLILDSFLDLTDEGFHIESCHQNGYSSYVIYDPELIYFTLESNKDIREIDEDYESKMKRYLSSLSKLYDSIYYNKERIVNTKGLEDFDFKSNSSKLEISFNHQLQGFGNLSTKILVGNEKLIYY